MDDILHDDILPFYFVFTLCSFLFCFEKDNYFITRGQVEVTTETLFSFSEGVLFPP